MQKFFRVAFVVTLTATSTYAANVPDKSIPPSVMMDVRVMESEFKTALASDCAPGRCFVKGCVYENHITLDQPRDSSLPGFPSEEGPGSVAPQEFLTRVRCEFTHEKSVRAADVTKLATRLEKRLSRGWLTVIVVPEALEPIPKSLSEPLVDKPEEEPPPEKEEPPVVVAEPEELTPELALRQLWDRLLPHSPWMMALFLFTLAVLMFIWAGRRLGAQSLEEKMMEAQIAQTKPPEPEPAVVEETPVIEAEPAKVQDEQFAADQEKIWNERLDKLANDDDDVISRLLREWLKMGEYGMLARALLVFGDRVSRAFESAPELALKKVEFASYFRDVEEQTLPSRAKFFRDLNQQAMASLLLSQDDVHLVRSLREDFGVSGIVTLARELPPRYGALLFALVDYPQQLEIASILSPELRKSVAAQLLTTTRISMHESAFLSTCLEAVKVGEPLPKPPTNGVHREHGPPLDTATALSLLLPHLASVDRATIFKEELARHGGSLPHWHENIAFGHMLTALPEEIRNDLLLEVDVRGLSAWLQTQQPEWRAAFKLELAGPLQNALAQTSMGSSPGELMRLAKRGHRELVVALKGAYARKGIKFVDLVS